MVAVITATLQDFRPAVQTLAALHHWQEARWSGEFLSVSQTGQQELPHKPDPDKLNALIDQDTVMVIEVVEDTVGINSDFPGGIATILASTKHKQFQAWWEQVTGTPERLADYLLVWKTPFLRLTPTQQADDYTAARSDLQALATARALTLPAKLSEIGPMDRWEIGEVFKHHIKANNHGTLPSGMTHCPVCDRPIPYLSRH